MPVPSLKELLAIATARGANVHTTEFEGALTSVQVIGLPGVSSFPLPASMAAATLRSALDGSERQMELALA